MLLIVGTELLFFIERYMYDFGMLLQIKLQNLNKVSYLINFFQQLSL